MDAIYGGTAVTAPCFDQKSGSLLVLSAGTGEIHQVVLSNNGQMLQTLANTSGEPSSLAFDSEGAMYVCDFAHQAILRRGSDGRLAEFVREYEGKVLKGPSALKMDSKGNMFFCDSGPLGETTLQSPLGSVFTISADGQLLQPLALECLAHPCAIAISPSESVLYIAEMMANRILRFVQRPAGVYHCSVFYQFSGGMGPSALVCDTQGTLYVARYDLASSGAKGVISVLAADGKFVRDVELPIPCELTGVALNPKEASLVVTEASTNCIYTVSLG
mmetsp:Transcript_44719/g.95103  ORF Transcript_44719/g.95103 Transcript_44719/m.95103 type:complete len:275 (-) Transcript_44719:261-1085(-)